VFLERPESVGEKGFSRLSANLRAGEVGVQSAVFFVGKANPNYGSSAIGRNLGGKCSASLWPVQPSASRWASFPFLNRNLRNPQLFHNLMRIKLLIENAKEETLTPA
jgi:hypothetical protein